jgi:dual specificity phosphatase 12
MEKYDLSPDQALMQVCEGRPVCDPNPGFKSQLVVYHRMLQANEKAAAEEIYERWVKERFTGDWWSWDRRYRESKM